MKRLLLLFVVGALMAALAATGAFAQDDQEAPLGIQGTNTTNAPRPGVNGTSASEVLFGGGGSDLIAGYEGDDYLVAAYAYWQVPSNAPASSDFIGGGPGNDVIDSADRAGAPDNVLCGPGIDVVYAGFEDFVAPGECEYVYRYWGF